MSSERRRFAIVGLVTTMTVLGFASWAGAQSLLPSGFYYPVSTYVATGCSYFLARDKAHGGCYPFDGYYHLGHDMKAPLGAPVFSIAAGTVVLIRPGGGTGNVALFIQHTLSDGSRFVALYGHVRSTVKVGDSVLPGATVATIGPWAATEPHLHMAIIPGTVIPPGHLETGVNAYWPSTNGFTDPIAWLLTRSPAAVATARLTVAIAGGGVVTSSQPGIACGGGLNACSADFLTGTNLTLTATASAGWTFAGWSGACSGTSACVVSMTAARTATATFIPASSTVGNFGKTGPVNANTRQSPAAVLTWHPAAGATSYEYCFDTTDNFACDTGWVSVGAQTMAAPPGLVAGVAYYWQVRGRNGTAVTESDGGVWWRFTTGSGSPFVCDVNYDGRADLIWQRSTDGLAAAWYMAGSSAFGGAVFPPDAAFGAAWRLVGVGDFNADRACDLLYQHTDGRLVAWMMDGTRRWGVVPLTPAAMTDPDTTLRAVADINGDGYSDLIWQKKSTGHTSAWLMNGTSRAAVIAYSPQQTDLGWTLVGAADMNEDGHPDLLWQHDVTRLINVWIMVGSVRQQSITIATTPDAGWELRAVGDTNWDGRPELFWQHTATGALGMWTVRGLVVLQASLLTPSANPDKTWRIVGPR